MDPRIPQDWRSLRSGLLVLAGLVLLSAAVFFLDTVRRELLEGPTLVVLADEIRGLAPGADVWVAGKPAGRVTAIRFVDRGHDDPGRVSLRVVLLNDAAPALRADAQASIGSSSLLAPPVVKLSPGTASAPPYDFADTLEVTPAPDLRTFRALADTGRAAMDSLVVELTALQVLMARGTGTLPRMRRDPGLVDRLTRRRSQFSLFTEAWSGPTGLGAFVRDSSARGGFRASGENLRQFTEDVTGFRPYRDDIPAARDALQARAERLAERIGAAEGTLGRMATDDELGIQTGRARLQLDSLLADVAAHPLRYLHFRLF
jgi:phospholipid/cholesterol/gamma-HCH transport system substrate-binding protein